ncbi:MAG: hypothetical protein ACLUKN_15055 [Bacilli bacterium]
MKLLSPKVSNWVIDFAPTHSSTSETPQNGLDCDLMFICKIYSEPEYMKNMQAENLDSQEDIKTSAKKPAAKKTAAKKVSAKKTAVKKTAGKKSGTKKPSEKRRQNNQKFPLTRHWK